MAATACGAIVIKCSLTIHIEMLYFVSNCCVCQAKPCKFGMNGLSPLFPYRRPKPTWVELAHGVAWSSRILREGFTEELHELFNGLFCRIDNCIVMKSHELINV